MLHYLLHRQRKAASFQDPALLKDSDRALLSAACCHESPRKTVCAVCVWTVVATLLTGVSREANNFGPGGLGLAFCFPVENGEQPLP